MKELEYLVEQSRRRDMPQKIGLIAEDLFDARLQIKIQFRLESDSAQHPHWILVYPLGRITDKAKSASPDI